THPERSQVMGATYRRRSKKGNSYLVTAHRDGQREYATVKGLEAAKALVAEIHRMEVNGVNVIEAMRKAKEPVAPAPTAPVFPPLRDAVEEFLTAKIARGDMRHSTVRKYRERLAKWVYPTLGETPIDKVTRKQLGAILIATRDAGKSIAVRN